MIKEFPESYKPYLRYLHSIHANWTFTPLNAKYDFYAGVAVEITFSSMSHGIANSIQIYRKGLVYCNEKQ